MLFVGRYGGDEFILIVRDDDSSVCNELIEAARKRITAACDAQDTPYLLSISAGCDELAVGLDSFRACVHRADSNMYLDKNQRKKSGETTLLHRPAGR